MVEVFNLKYFKLNIFEMDTNDEWKVSEIKGI